jgi:hypothetical protein
VGHIVSSEGLKVDPRKVASVEEWPRPETVTAARSFLDMTSYYRLCIQDYAKIALSLHELTQGNKPRNEKINWNPKCEVAFQLLKEKLTTAPVLKAYCTERTTIIETGIEGSNPNTLRMHKLLRALSHHKRAGRSLFCLSW